MRILAIHPLLDSYGSDRMFLRSAEQLVARGCEITVVTTRPGKLDAEAAANGLAPTYVPTAVLQKALLNPVGLVRFLYQWIRSLWSHTRLIAKVRPDAVYVNTLTLPVWLVAARLRRVPVICHVREAERGQPGVIQWGLRAPLSACQLVLANSKATAEWLRERNGLKNKTAVIYNGFIPDNPPVPQRVAGGDGSVVLVGRLSPRKGQDVAIKAIQLLRAGEIGAARDVRLKLLGDVFEGYEWFEAELRQLAKDAGVDDLVSFEGYQSDTAAFLVQASGALVPSLIEPFGNVAVEALLQSCPVIVSGVEGLLEIVTDGRTGIAVPPADERALAEAIERVFADPAAAELLASTGRDEVVERFGATRYANELFEHITAQARR